MSFFVTTRKPVDFGGRRMVTMMNSGHGRLLSGGASGCRTRRHEDPQCCSDPLCFTAARFYDIQISKNGKGWCCVF